MCACDIYTGIVYQRILIAVYDTLVMPQKSIHYFLFLSNRKVMEKCRTRAAEMDWTAISIQCKWGKSFRMITSDSWECNLSLHSTSFLYTFIEFVLKFSEFECFQQLIDTEGCGYQFIHSSLCPKINSIFASNRGSCKYMNERIQFMYVDILDRLLACRWEGEKGRSRQNKNTIIFSK